MLSEGNMHTPGELAGVRVLLVDDDDPLRDAVESVLRARGATVAAVPDALSAIARMEAGAEVDVVLAELWLPGVPGSWLAEWCAGHRPSVPVVLASARLPPGGSVLPPSVWRFVRKPFDAALVEVLVAAVRR